MNDRVRVYGYRWVVLAVFMLVNLMIQLLWISYAPITSLASTYYGVSDLAIGILAMSFMIAFIPLSLPAAWLIDTRGFRLAVGFGVVLMAVFGIARGLVGTNYTLVLLSTIGIAIAQPFLLDSWTKVPANWFAPGERAKAVGLVTLASMLGIALGMVLTPILADAMSIATLQLVYGLLAAASAVAFLALARERPATPPCPPGMDERALVLDGLKHALRVKPFLVMLGVAFIVMSAFNGVTTWVEQIIHPRGFSPTDAGIMGALMLVAGIIGAVVLPALSDRRGKRIRFVVIALAATVPGMLGIAFASSTLLLYAFAAVLGFFLVAVFPIVMQYAAEITNPTPEGTSNGLIQLCGQVSVVFVYIMAALRTSNGSFTVSLVLSAALLAACALAVSRLKDAAPAAARAGAATTIAGRSREELAGTVPTPPAGD
ncbi:MAG: MFS transporter [Actinobacteria bacterium]|nr:MFS transporter [Actinomycetota bacterium]